MKILISNDDGFQAPGIVALHQAIAEAAAQGVSYGRQIWVNFAFPENGKVDVIDTLVGQVVHRMEPGKGILHMEFAPRGENVWLSARDDNKVLIYSTETFAKVGEIAADSPSGIFFTTRAARTGF